MKKTEEQIIEDENFERQSLSLRKDIDELKKEIAIHKELIRYMAIELRRNKIHIPSKLIPNR